MIAEDLLKDHPCLPRTPGKAIEGPPCCGPRLREMLETRTRYWKQKQDSLPTCSAPGRCSARGSGLGGRVLNAPRWDECRTNARKAQDPPALRFAKRYRQPRRSRVELRTRISALSPGWCNKLELSCDISRRRHGRAVHQNHGMGAIPAIILVLAPLVHPYVHLNLCNLAYILVHIATNMAVHARSDLGIRFRKILSGMALRPHHQRTSSPALLSRFSVCHANPVQWVFGT
jgi:hypothetical protein